MCRRQLFLHLPEQGVRFWHHGQARALMDGAELGRRFFRIWPGESTTDNGLRTVLLTRLSP